MCDIIIQIVTRRVAKPVRVLIFIVLFQQFLLGCVIVTSDNFPISRGFPRQQVYILLKGSAGRGKIGGDNGLAAFSVDGGWRGRDGGIFRAEMAASGVDQVTGVVLSEIKSADCSSQATLITLHIAAMRHVDVM